MYSSATLTVSLYVFLRHAAVGLYVFLRHVTVGLYVFLRHADRIHRWAVKIHGSPPPHARAFTAGYHDPSPLSHRLARPYFRGNLAVKYGRPHIDKYAYSL